MELDNLVEALIREHEGGEKFFENLDKAVRKSKFLETLFYNLYTPDLMISSAYVEDPIIVVSGKFGSVFHNWLVHEAKEPVEVYVVEGGLRHTESTSSLIPYVADFQGKTVVFFDDSFYSGITRDVVKAAVEDLGAQLIGTYVVYDGSKEKDNTVKSLFRYHDKYGD